LASQSAIFIILAAFIASGINLALVESHHRERLALREMSDD